MKGKLYLVLDNIRSTYNVGSLLRTAEGLGIDKVYLCGYTPYPQMNNDTRLAHISRKINTQIKKTALGAELSQPWEHTDTTLEAINLLRAQGAFLVALEQAENSVPITEFKHSSDIALIIGNEIEGVSRENLMLADLTIELPMAGRKESFNVSVAAAMAMFYLKNML